MTSPLVPFSLALCLSASAVTFEKLTIDHAEADHPATGILSLDPLVMEAFEPIEDSFYYSRLVWGNNGVSPHLIFDSNQPPAPGEASNNLETFNTAGGGGSLFLLGALKLGGVNRADAFILRYDGSSFSEYVPRAKATLSDGQDHRFSYSLFDASDNGTLAVLGVDDRFNHFVLKATEGDVEVIAQESVTDFPGGTGKFTRFSNYPNISPDGSFIAFRGQENGGHTGLFVWSETNGFEIVGDSNATLPDGSTEWGNLEGSSSPAVFGYDNSLFIKHTGSGTLLEYADGTMNAILSNGDLVDGTAVADLNSRNDSRLAGLKPLPNGDLVYLDSNRFLLRSKGVWSELINLGDLPVNHSYRGKYFITSQHTYLTYSIYDPTANVESQYVVRSDYQGGGLEGVYQFDPNEVDDELSSIGEVHVGGGVMVIGSSGKYFATQMSALPAVDVSPAPPVEFASYVASLPEGMRGEDDDPDFDRMSNLVEFALKLDPSVPNAFSDGFTLSVLPASSFGFQGEEFYIRLEVNVHPEAKGFSVSPRHYLTPSGPASPGDTMVAHGNPRFHLGRQVQFYRSTIAVGDLPSAFFRLVVERDE